MYQLLVSKTEHSAEVVAQRGNYAEVLAALCSSERATELQAQGYRYWRMAYVKPADRRTP